MRSLNKISPVLHPVGGLSIPLSSDAAHSSLTNNSPLFQPKTVMQKKQMDRILHSIIKERMFGDLVTEGRKGRMGKDGMASISKLYRTINFSENGLEQRGNYIQSHRMRHHREASHYTQRGSTHLESPSLSKNLNRTFRTIDATQISPLALNQQSQTINHLDLYSHSKKKHQKLPKQLSFIDKDGPSIQEIGRNLTTNNVMSLNTKLPQLKLDRFNSKQIDKINSKQLQKFNSNKLQPSSPSRQIHKPKKLNLGEKELGPLFRSFSPLPPSAMLYDIKISKEMIISKLSNQLPSWILERFFLFFVIPPLLSYRQFCNTIEAIANTKMEFIYFFVFSILDESGNGCITISDLFRFMQHFTNNTYIETQIYAISNLIKSNPSTYAQPTLAQTLVTNHSLTLPELLLLLKQSSHASPMPSSVIKSTVYHQSILSLEHDVEERMNLDRVQDEKERTGRGKAKSNIGKEGIRLGDIGKVWNGRRPKIFCLLIQMLTERKAIDLE